MKEKLYEICGKIVEDEEESKKLSSYETLDELYKYFLKKVPNLTKEEFDEFVCECLKNYEKEQENITKLQGANLGAVSGGSMGWKERLAAGMLAVMSFIPAAGAAGNTSAGAGTPQSVSTQKSIKTKISDAFGKTKAWIIAHPKLTIGIGLAAATVVGGGIYLATRNTKDKGKQVDDEAKIGDAKVVIAGTQNKDEKAPVVKDVSVQPKSEKKNEKDTQEDVQKPKPKPKPKVKKGTDEVSQGGDDEKSKTETEGTEDVDSKAEKVSKKMKELEGKLKKYVDDNFTSKFWGALGRDWDRNTIIDLCKEALGSTEAFKGKYGPGMSFSTNYKKELLDLKFSYHGCYDDIEYSPEAKELGDFLYRMQHDWLATMGEAAR